MQCSITTATGQGLGAQDIRMRTSKRLGSIEDYSEYKGRLLSYR
jgi:hypothetical protein